jgi:hypothetical protein
MALTDLDDLRRISARPCNFEQMQEAWPKLLKYLDATGSGGIPETATSGWYLGGGNPYVLATINGIANVQVRIPNIAARLPNIKNGDDIIIAKKNGVWWVVSGVHDDPQYTLRYMSGGTIPWGWAKADGSANSTGNGGSGIDYTGRYIKGHGTVPGTSGGSTSYTPAGSVSSGTISISGTFTTTSETTGLTVDDYVGDSLGQVGMTEHVHRTPVDSISFDAGATSAFAIDPANPNLGGSAPSNWVETTVDYDSGDTLGDPKTWMEHVHDIGHGHTVTDAGHTHDVTISGSGSLTGVTFTGDSATIEPPYMTGIIIERLNNGLT